MHARVSNSATRVERFQEAGLRVMPLCAAPNIPALRGCCPPLRAAGRLNCEPYPAREQWLQAEPRRRPVPGHAAYVAGERRRSLSQYIELALEAHIEAVRGKKPKTKS